MSPTRPRSVFFSLAFMLTAASALPAAEPDTGTSAAEIKRVTDRYALTRARIGALLDMRLKPLPLPANPPNPFYQAPAVVLGQETAPVPDPVEVFVPAAADETDIDTLRRYSPTLRVGGVITRNGVLHLAINNTTCKVGDIITVGHRDRPIYLKLLDLTLAEFTIGLNDAHLVVPLRK